MISLVNLNIPIISLCVASLIGAVSVYFLNKKEDEEEEDEIKFVKVGTIEKLFIYPVKSMKGISVPYIECTKVGGNYKYIKDRSFMVVDRKTSLYIGGKKERKIVLIEPSLNYDSITSSFVLTLKCSKNKTSVSVNLNEVVKNGIIISAKVFDDGICDGYDCGDEVSNFIKNILDSSADLRLMYHTESLFRQRHAVVGPKYSNTNVSKGPHEIRYQDDVPFNILTKESINDLNKRLNQNDFLLTERFRPNILVSGCKPYEEDFWKYIKISSSIFEYLKPCTRCIQTTINPLTAEKHPNLEPLKELRKYRLANGRIAKEYGISPVFGVHVGVKNGGIIKVGDDVYASYKKVSY
ncbi:Molybdenum cofactor sulfurase, C-terminal domain and MOSC, N-terminal beta barrel domain and Pyruvate kinase-like, insert domain-containing protein [Strongyloides ratti]|uniref:Molybdenum cofactor sulfurase, C-terminal domain and MOSC, N-terminal beta barrel domain and Pyruvate kinase-like, insert domain-containing protein n=1 Tax=Strongyloides ratti TaxID=34506 RepID=A0A090LPV2_STRRB|nr:Molybdenum cofactor sulfurase, C-terminal domain and MOSC, N-terminal beta barrel domain and Pyruvate kinase-like, insert domain-containing protein [Strongyloides ratti]CEF69581.1 Molybdenum cofactor sulfurase, C-terminal domain and MOSC, N-terminal beta barrel domain and Pyruvate kinase-like, insert domain-containing protein [Strongyloides ratti]